MCAGEGASPCHCGAGLHWVNAAFPWPCPLSAAVTHSAYFVGEVGSAGPIASSHSTRWKWACDSFPASHSLDASLAITDVKDAKETELQNPGLKVHYSH